MNINPICLMNVHVFKEYKILRFGDTFEINDFSNFDEKTGEFKKRIEKREPNQLFLNFYKNLTGRDRDNIDGEICMINATNEAFHDYIANGPKHTYNPLEDTPNLYLDMIKIKPFDEKSLLDFSSNYGLLTDNRNEWALGSPIGGGHENTIVDSSAIIKPYHYSLKELRELVELWEAIQNGGYTDLQKIKYRFEEEAKERFFERKQVHEDYIDEIEEDKNLETENNTSFEIPLLYKIWRDVRKQPIEEIVKHYLSFLLRHTPSGEYCVQMHEGNFVTGVSFFNLLEVGFHQFKSTIANDIKLLPCKNCGQLFHPTHGLQKFCPSSLNTKRRTTRSTCENSYHSRLKRLRKKILTLTEEGKNLKEIANLTKQSQSTIKSIQEQYRKTQ